MSPAPVLAKEELDALRQFDTCMVANAVERFNLRLRNTGFTNGSIHCMFPEMPQIVGYAVTARLRTGEPPIRGGAFHDRSELWNNILKVPSPRILVLQDIDNPPGIGAFLGDMHAAILRSLGCIAYLTNGSVRDLPAVGAMGFQLFAGGVVASHAYSHVFDIGSSIGIGGLEVHPGTLLHGGRHGVLSVPAEVAAQIPSVAARLQQQELDVIEFCSSEGFSIGKLSEIMKQWG
jgi:regulator of RNase E activity RraA